MMSEDIKEPVALFHAKWLANSLTIGAAEAAAELRRLHEVEKQRDELLEALEGLLEYSGIIEERCDSVSTDKARAAIAKAKGGA